MQYEILIEGHLGARWEAWFEGFAITSASDGTTVLRGHVVDQAALHGLVSKLRDLGVPLISLAPVETPTHERHAPDPVPLDPSRIASAPRAGRRPQPVAAACTLGACAHASSVRRRAALTFR